MGFRIRFGWRAVKRYVMRHWRGEYPLAIAFWVTGLIFLSPLSLALSFTEAARRANYVFSQREEFLFIVFPMLFDFLVAPWAMVGIWRSAGVRLREGHRVPGYGVRAIIVVRAVLYVVLIMILASAASPRFVLGARMADFILHGYTMFQRGGTLSLSGQLTPRAADEITGLAGERRIRLLALTNVNGAPGAARDLAALVGARRITVMVGGRCEAACATVLLAAPRRVAQANAHIESRGTVLSLRAAIDAGFVTHVVARRHIYRAATYCAANPSVCGEQ